MHRHSSSRTSSALRLAALCAALLASGLSVAAGDVSLTGAPVGPAASGATFFKLIDVDEIVYDRSQVEWSEAYLQWIATFARGSSPVTDTTGALCGARQDGDVWFLAHSEGTAPVVRRCTVPAGKTLFVPIAVTTERSGNRDPDCGSMARIAAGTLTQQVGQLAMRVDGQALDNLGSHRVATGDCFALGLRQVPRSALKTAVADGYYVMLKPLAAGPHTIVVGARFGDATLSTTYKLDVN